MGKSVALAPGAVGKHSYPEDSLTLTVKAAEGIQHESHRKNNDQKCRQKGEILFLLPGKLFHKKSPT
jgi:hypothetical protein